MKTKSVLAFAMAIALSGAAFAQTGGGAGGGAGGAGGGGGSAGGAAGGAGVSGGVSSGSGGPSMGAGVTTSPSTNAPATGGVPSTPGGLNNQLQSNQTQQTGRNAPGPMQPSTQTTVNPGVSGSARDATARAQCANILANRDKHSADQVAACERSTTADDPAAAADQKLQRANDRAVNSICRGC